MRHFNFIDGLRAFAVLSVVFFHANYNFFNGGYLGVDIFFVLSGFLILASIVNSYKKGTFSLIVFYKKRFLRIIPAALFVLSTVIIIAFITMFPEELSNLFKSVLSILFLSSNVLASKSIDYFGISVEFLPLIHYWSLSIELQFYLIFPLLVYFLIVLKRENSLLYVLIGILILSLSYVTFNQTLSHSEKYFSTLMRLWEFSLGGVIYLLREKYLRKINLNYFYHNLLLFLSLGVIIISVVMFDDASDVPGLITLIPTLSVGLILFLGSDKTYFGSILSFTPLRFIGIISFSFYLIHQPVFAFYRIIYGRNFSLNESIVLIIFSFLISIIVWFFIEKPFQKNGIVTLNIKFIIILICGIIVYIITNKGINKDFSAFILNGKVKDYLSYRYDNNPRLKECRTYNRLITPGKACIYGDNHWRKNFAFWGDSHINQISLPLSEELNKSFYKVSEFSIAGCPPIVIYKSKNKLRQCNKNANLVFNYISSNNEINDVLIFAYWSNYLKEFKNINEPKVQDMVTSFRKSLNELIKEGKRVHIIYPTPIMNVNPPLRKARELKLFNNDQLDIVLSENEFLEQNKLAKEFLDISTKNLNVNRINISKLIKTDNLYYGNNDNLIFYRDNNHLSLSGGYFIAKETIEEVIKYNENN